MNIIETYFKINVPLNNQPAYIIIHHALASNCSIYDVHRWHLSNGWAGCGYHYFISKEGKIYRGRMEEQRGSHCKQEGMNMKSIGICLEGCYQDYKGERDKVVPDAQLEALSTLTKYLMKKYEIGIGNVKKHHDVASYKLCPGNYFPWRIYLSKLEENHQVDITKLQKENNQYKSKIIHLSGLLKGVTDKINDIERLLKNESNT